MTKDLTTLQKEFNEQIIERIGVKLRTDEIKSLVTQALGHKDFAGPMKMAAAKLRKKKFKKLSIEKQSQTDVKSLELNNLEKLQILIQVGAWKGDNVIENLLLIQSQLANLLVNTSKDYENYLKAIEPTVNKLKWLDPLEQAKEKKTTANQDTTQWNSKTWQLIQNHLNEVRELKAAKEAEEKAELQRIKDARIEAERKLEEEKTKKSKELEIKKQLTEEKAKKELEEARQKEVQLEQTKEILEDMLTNRLQRKERKRPLDEPQADDNSQNKKVKIDANLLTEIKQAIPQPRKLKVIPKKRVPQSTATETPGFLFIDPNAKITSDTFMKYAKQLRDGDWLSWFLIPVFGYKRTRRFKAETLEEIAKSVLTAASKGEDFKGIILEERINNSRLIKSCFWHETARTKNLLQNAINNNCGDYTKPPRQTK